MSEVPLPSGRAIRSSHFGSIARAIRGRIAGALAVRALGAVLQLGLAVVLGRYLGASGVGIYYLYTAWLALLGTVAAAGLPLFVMRTNALLYHRGEGDRARRVTLEAMLWVGIIGIGLAIPIVSTASRLVTIWLGSAALRFVLTAAAVSAAGWGILRVLAATWKAANHAKIGLTVEYALVPALLLTCVGYLWVTGIVAEPHTVVWLHAGALGAAALLALPVLLSGRIADGTRRKAFDVRGIGTFAAITLLNAVVAAAPFILLPWYATAAQIGQFAVAYKLTMIPSTILLGMASVFAPRFSREYGSGDRAQLRRSFRESQWLSIGAYAPFMLAFLLIPAPILGLFGPDFIEASTLLAVLAVAHAFNAASGLVGFLLNMTNREGLELLSSLASLIVMVVVAMVLGPVWGVMGIAIAFASSLVLKNIMSLAFCSVVLRRPNGG